jgi:SAM-dependent methyltransferase
MGDRLAEFYDTKYRGEVASAGRPPIAPCAIPRDRYQACVSHLPRVWRGGRLLELGAGEGLVARSLLAAGLDVEHFAVSERSEARVAALEQRMDDPRVEVLRLDAEDVGTELRGHFDGVVMVALIEHLVDPLGAMQRVRGLLRPGGIVYIDTPNIAKYTRRVKLLFGRFPATSSRDEGLRTYAGEPVSLHDEGHLHYFTYRSLTRMLTERCGFAQVERLPYFSGGRILGPRGDHALARLWPTLFSEACLVARA